MTKYAIMTYNDGEWTGQALFSDALDFGGIEAYAMALYMGTDFADVAIVDNETGEVLWNGVDAEDYDHEPGDIDDDCGFDPYMGCFSDDC